MRATAWYLVLHLLQRFLNEAQDETRVVITQQAVRKKKAYTYILKIGLTNLQALYRSSKVEIETRTPKKWFF